MFESLVRCGYRMAQFFSTEYQVQDGISQSVSMSVDYIIDSSFRVPTNHPSIRPIQTLLLWLLGQCYSRGLWLFFFPPIL